MLQKVPDCVYLCKTFPIVLHLRRLISPLFANNLRNIRICEARILGNNLSLIMLTVEDESYKETLALRSLKEPLGRNKGAKCEFGTTPIKSLNHERIWIMYHFVDEVSWGLADKDKLVLLLNQKLGDHCCWHC